jgi:hypothetical protein
MTHDKLNSLGEDRLSQDTFIIYDEAPRLWFEKAIDLDHLWEVIKLTEKFPELADLAYQVDLLIRAQLSPATDHLYLDECFKEADEGLKLLAKTLLDQEEFAFPSPTKSEQLSILRGGAPTLPPGTREIIKSICQSLVGVETELELIVRSHLEKVQLTIEKRSTFKPKTVDGKPLSTVVLDATPTDDLDVIVQAQGRGYELKTEAEGSIKGVVLNEGYYWKNSYLNSSRIFYKGRIKKGHAENLEKIALNLQARLEALEDGAHVAVLASKPLSQMLQNGTEAQYQNEAGRHSITQILERFKVSHGHFFAHSRGSNQFQNCEALILLGSCRLELACAQARHRALERRGRRIDFDHYYKKVNQGELDQAIGRGRGLRRSVLTLVYGPVSPTQSQHDTMVWRTRELRGREASEATKLAKEYALEHALCGGGVSANALVPFGVSLATCRRILRDLATDDRLRIVKDGNTLILTCQPDFLQRAKESLRVPPPVDEPKSYVIKTAEEWLRDSEEEVRRGEEAREWLRAVWPDWDTLREAREAPLPYQDVHSWVTERTPPPKDTALEDLERWLYRRDELEWEIEWAEYQEGSCECEVYDAQKTGDPRQLEEAEYLLENAKDDLETLRSELAEHLELIDGDAEELLEDMKRKRAAESPPVCSKPDEFFALFGIA